MNSLRVGVIGLGFMGGQHARALLDLPGVELAAVADPDPRKQGTIKLPDSVHFHTSYESLLSEVDAVVVATPEQTHLTIARDVIGAGKHLLLEKPAAGTAEDADSLLALATTATPVCLVGHLLRHDARIEQARTAVLAGNLGDVRYLKSWRRSPVATRTRVGGQTTLPFYLGVHDFDLAAWLTGQRVVRVHAEGAARIDGNPGYDAILASLQLEGGGIAHVELSWISPMSLGDGVDAGIRIVGSEGVATISLGGDVLIAEPNTLRRPDTALWPTVFGAPTGVLRRQAEHWVDCIRTGAPPRASMADGVRASQVAFAVDLSLKTGAPVDV